MSANDFLNAFSGKVEAVRSSTASAPEPTYTADTSCSSLLDAFDEIGATYIQKLVHSAPNKSCALDPVPTWLVKKFAMELSPFLAILFNRSMCPKCSAGEPETGYCCSCTKETVS